MIDKFILEAKARLISNAKMKNGQVHSRSFTSQFLVFKKERKWKSKEFKYYELLDKVAVMEYGKIVEQGDVFDIFANPQNEVTKRFIRATSNLTKIEELIAEDSPVVHLEKGEKLVRFKYIQKDVSEPLISATSRLYDITMNIIFAEIDFVQGAPIGGTVAIVSGKPEAIERALEHIRGENVGVEVLKEAE